MRSKLMSLLTVIGAVTVLVLAANTLALATTGKAILAGKINTSTKLTTIVRTTPGTGLQVKTKSAANAPFAVNGKGKVVNLNADTVDGLDSSALITKPLYLTKEVINATTSMEFTAPLPTGTFLFSYSVFFQGSSNLGDVNCFVRQFNGSPKYVGETTHLNVDQTTVGLSGSGLVARGTGGSIALHCDTSTPFTTASNQPIQFILTKVNGTGV